MNNSSNIAQYEYIMKIAVAIISLASVLSARGEGNTNRDLSGATVEDHNQQSMRR